MIMLSASSSFPSTNLFTKSPAIAARRSSSSFQIRASQATIPRSGMAASSPSLYDVLGLSVGANCMEIKTAYRRLARSCHPDVCKGSSSPDEFMRIHAAYSTLSDPNKRADYDRELVTDQAQWWRQQQQQRQSTVHKMSKSQSFSGVGRSRTWETDQCW